MFAVAPPKRAPVPDAPTPPNGLLASAANPATDQVAMGPLIDAGQRDKVHDIVTASVSAGADVAAGGRYDELFYQATVLADVPPQARAFTDEWALSLITRRVDEAVAQGARVLAGGSPEPPCYPATVLTDVPKEIELAFDETFGPVVVLEVVDDAADAVQRANASAFGLAAGILAADSDRGLEVARTLDAGIVHVNDQPVNDEPQMPFGGIKDSGWGRFGVTFAAEEFTDLQWITSRATPRTFPF